jgi:nucleotide-binding universal stress UspA family protein
MTAPGAIRSMLVALDESERKTEVLRAAARLARTTQPKVYLIRVLLIPPQIPPGAHMRPDGLEPMLVKQAEAELHGLMADLPDIAFGIPLVVIDGNPWRRIVETSKALDVDLVIVGNHKHHGLDVVFESVATKVVNHADRDVLVVRVRDVPGRASG